MSDEARPATDDEASLWHCEACCKSGVLLLQSHAAVYLVVEALSDAHAAQSPDCDADIGLTRVTRPTNWFISVTDLAKHTVKERIAAAGAKKRGKR